MTFVILNWVEGEPNSVLPIQDEETGETMSFDSHLDAQNYAKESVNFNWQIVGI